mmetsp:Transcript_31155/g.75977  ORF Transcript_31155/g.75977 Transcript_31155/m.75977 type:complete len:204 (-) Transcript_31155:2947-3558(-)
MARGIQNCLLCPVPLPLLLPFPIFVLVPSHIPFTPIRVDVHDPPELRVDGIDSRGCGDHWGDECPFRWIPGAVWQNFFRPQFRAGVWSGSGSCVSFSFLNSPFCAVVAVAGAVVYGSELVIALSEALCQLQFPWDAVDHSQLLPPFVERVPEPIHGVVEFQQLLLDILASIGILLKVLRDVLGDRLPIPFLLRVELVATDFAV